MVADERSPLLQPTLDRHNNTIDEEAASIIRSHISSDERELADASVGERLPYNDYTTIDWLHDLVKESYRLRVVRGRKGLKFQILSLFDKSSGWIAAALIGALTACVAFLVDVSEAVVSDWKMGYCSRNPFLTREGCCEDKTPLFHATKESFSNPGVSCEDFKEWTTGFTSSFIVYLGFALVFGLISGSVTMLTKTSLPAVSPDPDDKPRDARPSSPPAGKTMYMASGSGIPEIKTILSGFVIPHFLDFKVLAVKAVGAVFAVATGMCLGKEGPFVHISTCVGHLVAQCFPKYRDNDRKMREILSAACASGLSVAFGAPIGGVLFSYEEISTYFPRKVLWRAFLCSLVAAMTLRALNPTGTGKLVLFETNYDTTYRPIHYLVFVLLGVAGGIFGGTFCRLNFLWSKWFRSFYYIKKYPVFETFLIVLATVLLQYPNPLTREPGDVIIENLLVDCREPASQSSWVCEHEALDSRSVYSGYLIAGTLTKLVLTIITFGIKVPSGVIIPALDAGAFFGRLVGQLPLEISPGIFAMVGAAAFLAGVSRMTLSLCVIMFELTGELEYVVPHMVAILVAKWTADALGGRAGVYDIAQEVLGHPFLDADDALSRVQTAGVTGHLRHHLPRPTAAAAAAVIAENLTVRPLVPPPATMREITVAVPPSGCVGRAALTTKLAALRARGLMDAGLVLVCASSGMLRGYLAQGELEFGLGELGRVYPADALVRVLAAEKSEDSHANGDAEELDVDVEDVLDLSHFVDRTPLTICDAAPLEYAVEMFSKLGLRHLMVVEEKSGKLAGVVIKKRLVAHLESLPH